MMPFAYYGAKHGLAAKYPPPAHRTVIEPFAGSAGYSVHHASRVERVVLIDADPKLIGLWHELQRMTPGDVDDIGAQICEARFDHPLLAGMAGSKAFAPIFAGKPQAVTPRMRKDWPHVRRRILGALPHIARWEIVHGVYTDAPDIEATWFVDPPYQPLGTMAGSGYRFADIDYEHLGQWCKARRGQVIVCEQSPATWLPFYPLARQLHGGSAVAGGKGLRTEVIWRNDAEQLALIGSEVDTSEKDQVTP